MTVLHVRIGTRASQLAQWQAHWVADELLRLGATVEIVEISTRGDRHSEGPIPQLGHPGVFTKELQSALLAERVDVAVHSLKDLPTQSVDGLVLAAVPPRASPADALITNSAQSLTDLPQGARVGTGSPRRRAQIKSLRSDLEVVDLRGNLDTRLRKLDARQYDAIVLAEAGLRRLGWEERIVELLAPPRMLPAPGQGALAVECRLADPAFRLLIGSLDDLPTRQAVEAERSLLERLGAGCSAPVGAWGRVESGQLVLDGLVADLAGSRLLRVSARGETTKSEQLGFRVADELLRQGAAELVAAAKNV